MLLIKSMLMLGTTFLLSTVNLFYRDVRHAVPLMMTVWMYLCPIVYPLDKVPEHYLSIYMLNPMVVILDSYRKTALQGQEPMWGYLGLATVVSAVVLVGGYMLFKRKEPSFAEIV